MMIGQIMSLIDLFFALLELALFLRLILPWFRLPSTHGLYHFLVAVTEPVVEPVRRWIGGPPMLRTGQVALDVSVIVTFFALTLLHSLIQIGVGLALGAFAWLLHPADDFGFWLSNVLDILVQLYLFILLARVLLELLRIPPRTPLLRFIWDATEPFLAPIRQQLRPYVGIFDLSPLILYILILVLRSLLIWIIRIIF